MLSSSDSGEKADPNLTPILDMVFQLITFFMLMFSIRAADIDLNLNLPVVGSAVPADDDSTVEYFVLNLKSNESLVVQGREEFDIENYIAVEGRFRKDMVSNMGSDRRLVVVVRADRELSTRFLLRVVDSCMANGLDRFDFMVLSEGQSL